MAIPLGGTLRLTLCVLLLAVGLLLVNDAGILHQGVVLFLLGILNALVGGLLFWFHGSARITAAGIFGLAVAVFVGISAVWWSVQAGPVQSGMEQVAAATAACVVLMWSLFWRRSPTEGSVPHFVMSRPVTRNVMVVAVPLALVTGASTKFSYGFSTSVPVQICLGCLTLTLVALLGCLATTSIGRWRLVAAQAATALGVVALTGVTVFTGYGRMNLVSLGLAGLVVMSAQADRLWLKGAALTAVGPALLLLSYVRQVFFEHRYGVTTNGALSVFTPLRDCARLADRVASGVVHYDFGQNMLAPLVFWIPRSMWSGKPLGLGADLGGLLGYTSTSSEQSWASMFLGDFVLALGWWSLIFVVVVVGLVVRALDAWWVRQLDATVRGTAWVVRSTLVIVFVSDLGDYVWGGSFTYISRCVLRSVPLLGLLALLWALRFRPGWSRPSEVSPRRDGSTAGSRAS